MRRSAIPKLLLPSLLLVSLSWAAPAFAAPQLPSLNPAPTGLSLPGKFIWFDLATPELEEQKLFYRDLFGWTYRVVAGTDEAYSLVSNNGREIAGMFSYVPEDGSMDSASWIVLMSVSDTDQAVQTAKASGGRVNVPATTVVNRGRHALLEDPGGAQFGVLKSSSGDPPERDADLGDILWVDLFSLDPAQALTFYGSLAPYATEEREVREGLTRTLLFSQDVARASVIQVADDANRSSWVPYVRVADVEATLEQVVAAGGFAIVPPDPELLDGNLAIFVDPHGAVVGIVNWEPEQAGQEVGP